jgi:hypothetical protein
MSRNTSVPCCSQVLAIPVALIFYIGVFAFYVFLCSACLWLFDFFSCSNRSQNARSAHKHHDI